MVLIIKIQQSILYYHSPVILEVSTVLLIKFEFWKLLDIYVCLRKGLEGIFVLKIFILRRYLRVKSHSDEDHPSFSCMAETQGKPFKITGFLLFIWLVWTYLLVIVFERIVEGQEDFWVNRKGFFDTFGKRGEGKGLIQSIYSWCKINGNTSLLFNEW